MTFPLWLTDLAHAEDQWMHLRASHAWMLDVQRLNRLYKIAGWQLGD